MAEGYREGRSGLISFFRGLGKKRLGLLTGAVVFLALFSAGAKIAGDSLYNFKEDPAAETYTHEALVVVLAGGKGRIETAFELYASGAGSALFVVGAGPKSNFATITRSIDPEVMQKLNPQRLAAVAVDTESRNTIENALIVERYLRQNPKVKELVLVTSSYHMRRSLFILRHLLGNEVRIHPYIPPKESVAAGNWWQSWVGIQVTLSETFKWRFAKFLIPRLGMI